MYECALGRVRICVGQVVRLWVCEWKIYFQDWKPSRDYTFLCSVPIFTSHGYYARSMNSRNRPFLPTSPDSKQRQERPKEPKLRGLDACFLGTNFLGHIFKSKCAHRQVPAEPSAAGLVPNARAEDDAQGRAGMIGLCACRSRAGIKSGLNPVLERCT